MFLSHFTSLMCAYDGKYVVGRQNFVDRQLVDKFLSKIFCRQSTSSTQHFVEEHFVDRTLRRQIISSTEYFVDSTFRRQSISLTGHFVDSTFRRQITWGWGCNGHRAERGWGCNKHRAEWGWGRHMYTGRIILICSLSPVSSTSLLSPVSPYPTCHCLIGFYGKPNKTCDRRKMRRK
jgi:hypothetical protein